MKTIKFAEILSAMLIALTALCVIVGRVEPSLKTIEVAVFITLIAVILKDK